MNQLRQRHNVTDLLLKFIVLFGQIQHRPFAVGLMELCFLDTFGRFFVHMLDVIQCCAAQIDFTNANAKCFELERQCHQEV